MSLISEIVTKITADNSQFKKAVVESESKVSSFGKSAATMATISTAAFAAVVAGAGLLYDKIGGVADKYSEMYDNAQKIGINAQKLQELTKVADEAGVSSEQLNKMLEKMNLSIGKAAAGGHEQKDAFKALGLSITDLVNSSPEQRLIKISNAVKGLGDETKQTAAIFPILGKGSAESLGLLNSDLDKSIEKFHKLGISLTDTQQKALDSFSETKKTFGEFLGAGFEKFSSGAAAPFEDLLKGLMDSKSGFLDLEAAGKSFAETTSKGIRGTITLMGGLLSVAGMVGKAFDTAGTSLGESLAWRKEKISGFFDYLHNESIKTSIAGLGVSAVPNLGLNPYAANAGASLPPSALGVSNIPSISGEKFIQTSFAVSLDAASKAAEKFAKAADKSADDMITNALKSSAGTGDLLGRVVSGSNADKVKADTADFESLASDLINFSQNNSGSFENKRYQANTLSKLENMANFASQQGEDATAMREVLKSLQAWVTKTQGAAEVNKLQVEITPTKYAHIEWSLSGENKTIVDGIVEDKMAREARSVAR